MRIRLIRHGMTALGSEHRYQGSTDTPLSEDGSAALMTPDDAAVVYHSPLLRAAETARLLFPSAELAAVPGLREMDFGAFEGRGWWEMEQDAAYRAWVDGGCLGRCPGGEDRAAFSERVCTAFSALLERAMAENAPELVIVAHGGTQMAVLERWGEPKRDYYRWQTACGAGYELETQAPDRLKIIREVCYTR